MSLCSSSLWTTLKVPSGPSLRMHQVEQCRVVLDGNIIRHIVPHLPPSHRHQYHQKHHHHHHPPNHQYNLKTWIVLSIDPVTTSQLPPESQSSPLTNHHHHYHDHLHHYHLYPDHFHHDNLYHDYYHLQRLIIKANGRKRCPFL